MKLNIIYSGMGLSSLADKPAWQQEAEDELFAMIRASGIILDIQYYIDDPCSMAYNTWDAGCGWVVHADARVLANTTPQDVFATLIFWKPAEGQCGRWDGISYSTFKTGFDERPAFVVNANPGRGLQCDDCTNDFRCVYGYIMGHEFFHQLEDWVKWKLLLDGPVDANGNSPNMPSGDNTALCNTIGLCQGTNATGCKSSCTSGCAVHWASRGSKPCYQCFFDMYLPEVCRMIDEHDYVEPPPPTKNNTWLWIIGLGVGIGAILLLKGELPSGISSTVMLKQSEMKTTRTQ